MNDNLYLVFGAVLLVCLLVGLFAPALNRPQPTDLIKTTLILSTALFLLTVALIIVGNLDLGTITGCICESLFMLCVWLAQWGLPGGYSGYGSGGGGGGGGPQTPPPCDWDEFDRVRASWQPQTRRPRTPAGV